MPLAFVSAVPLSPRAARGPPPHGVAPRRHTHFLPGRLALQPHARARSGAARAASATAGSAGPNAASAAEPTKPAVDTFTFSVGHSRASTLTDALHDAARRAAQPLLRRGRTASAVLFFVQSTFETHPKDEARRVVPALRKTLAMLQLVTSDTVFVGCTTGPSSTPDSDPVASVALVHVPGDGGAEDADVPTVLRSVRLPDSAAVLDWGVSDWHDRVGLPGDAAAPAALLLLRAPDGGPEAGAALLSGLDFAYPCLRKLGAEAGRTSALHDARIYDADGVVPDGEAVALVIQSAHVAFDVLVAQAARPVGPPLEVVEVRDGTEIARVRELGTPGAAVAPPMVLLDMWGSVDSIPREDVEAAKKYLLLGTEVASVADMAALALGGLRKRADPDGAAADGDGNGNGDDGPDEGDAKAAAAPEVVELLTRKVLGFDNARGSVAVEGDAVSLGSRAQFQVRDAEAARGELDAALRRLRLEAGARASDGLALMGAVAFVDVERGDALYGKGLVDLDRTMFQERFGVPVATLTSARQVGPLPAGGLRGDAGRSYSLAASAVFVAVYGRIGEGVEVDEDGRVVDKDAADGPDASA